MARTKPQDGRKQRAAFTKRLTVSKLDPVPSGGAEPRRHRLPACQPLAARHRSISRCLPGRDRDRRRASSSARRSSSPASTTRPRGCAPPWPRAVAAPRLAYVGRRSLGDGVPWLQVLGDGDRPRRSCRGTHSPLDLAGPDRPARPTAGRRAAPRHLCLARRAPCRDPVRARARVRPSGPRGQPADRGRLAELRGAPDLSVLRDAIRIMRELNREEDIALLYFGGVRTGTDAAKLVGLGANAVIVGMSLALAVGGRIEDGAVAFYGDIRRGPRREGRAVPERASSPRRPSCRAAPARPTSEPRARGPARHLGRDGEGDWDPARRLQPETRVARLRPGRPAPPLVATGDELTAGPGARARPQAMSRKASHDVRVLGLGGSQPGHVLRCMV